VKRFRALVAALAAALAVPASAAELTRIASSFEDDDPFGMFLDVAFERTQLKSKIVREHHQNGTVEDVSELWFTEVDSRLNLDLHLGLWQDLEFRYRLPVVFAKDRRLGYARGTDESNSTITNQCVEADGQLVNGNCPDNPVGRGEPIFGVPHTAFRGGLGNMSFGLAYAIFNQRKDPTKPTWVVSVDYEAPTAQKLDPTSLTAPNDRGAIGDRIHKYTFATSFSRRTGAADPYFRAHYTLPIRGPGYYSNCEHPDPNYMSVPGNCGIGPWPRAVTGIRPPHLAGVAVGSEFNAYDQPSTQQKFALDVRLLGNYVSQGRYYNELSDALAKLLYTEDHLQLGGQFGLVAYAADFFRLTTSASLLYNTEHTLTAEQIGQDVDGDGMVSLARTEELNPNFDYRVDMVSRRLRASESHIFRLDVGLSFNF
jgi:hypothetical protein